MANHKGKRFGKRTKKNGGQKKKKNTKAQAQARTPARGQGRRPRIVPANYSVEQMDTLLEQMSNEDEGLRDLKNEEVQALFTRCCNEDIKPPTQKRFIECVIKQHTSYTAKKEQTQALWRICFMQSDTILAAKTGFGKSIPLQLFSLITGLITIQIVPLNRLGAQHEKDIKKFGGIPCLITAETKKIKPKIMAEIRKGAYTHLILSPEQAANPIFRGVIRDHLKDRIGLIAIDELHFVSSWKDFRPDFQYLKDLRECMWSNTPLFGCTATLDIETEVKVKLYAGFRPDGPDLFMNEVIRTPVDRPEIQLVMKKLEAKELKGERLIFSCLQEAFDEDKRFDPSCIHKTIVFIDGKTTISQQLQLARQALVDMSIEAGQELPAMSARRIIDFYTGETPEFDQTALYKDFGDHVKSTCRIVLATSALGTGLTMQGLDRVILVGFPIDGLPLEFWQRVGRVGRTGGPATAIWGVPYWAFDSAEKIDQVVQSKAQQPKAKKRATRNVIPARGRSSLHVVESVVEPDIALPTQSTGSRGDDEASEKGSVYEDGQEDSQPQGRGQTWSQTDSKRRGELHSVFRQMINGPCIRQPVLEHLGQLRVPVEDREPAPVGRCCSSCNPDVCLFDTPELPKREKPSTKPPKNSRQWYGLNWVIDWLQDAASKMIPSHARTMPIPSDYLLETEQQWRLAREFGGLDSGKCDSFAIHKDGALEDIVGSNWFGTDELLRSFRDALRTNVDEIIGKWRRETDKKRTKKTKGSEPNGPIESPGPPAEQQEERIALQMATGRREHNLIRMATDASFRRLLKKPVAPTVEVRSSPPRDEDDIMVVVDEDSQDVVCDSQGDITIADSQGTVPETQIVNMRDLTPSRAKAALDSRERERMGGRATSVSSRGSQKRRRSVISLASSGSILDKAREHVPRFRGKPIYLLPNCLNN